MASCGATVATSPAHCCHGIVLWKKKHSLEFLRKTEGLEQSSTRLTTAQRLTGLGRRRRGCTLLIFAIEILHIPDSFEEVFRTINGYMRWNVKECHIKYKVIY
ncbi:unnamed protein product [Acanthoscelides obtectus]|uniref:Uncharacterized protein n=1 Tax=Acanthoscelides obtectus TaxID=200917 RepID=A0A9P0PAA1_ACAOB|nr:unnamed protein product [Acanthoscelides obtectus]CAK1656432.1 hypothetical protein AOBTE_LOCUS19706 [Acanthoscelides obtectus]